MAQPGGRSAALDAVRVLAIVAVVAGHVWSGPELRPYVYTWHVPVFFLLTGYLWRPGRSVVDEVGRRARTLLVPYVWWLALLLGGLVAVSLAQGDAPALGTVRDVLLGGSYAGRPFSAFWFVTALFVSAVLYRVVSRLSLPWQWLVAAGLVLLGQVAGPWLALVPWSVGLAVPCVAFLVAGRTFAVHRGAVRGAAVPLVGLLLLGVGAALVVGGAAAPLDLKDVELGTPGLSVVVAVLLSVGLVLLAEAFVPRLPGRVQRPTVALAGAGLMVVLTHAFVLWLLQTPPQGRPVDFLLALLVPWAGGLLLARSRWAAPLLGRAPAR